MYLVHSWYAVSENLTGSFVAARASLAEKCLITAMLQCNCPIALCGCLSSPHP